MSVQPNRFFQLSLIFLVALNLVPHFADYTVPTLAVGGICLCWRLLYEFQLVPLPNFFTKIGLVIALTYLVYLNYGQIFGLESGSALLICAVALKLVDRVGYRDAMVLLFLNFMLLLARFFESQSLGISIFAAFDMIITTALLVQLHNGARFKFNMATLLKTGSKLALQITPFMVLLFFVFPRFSTNFLSIRTSKTKLAGFSETMDPGAVASVAQSDQIAFRVRFYGSAPPANEMYWRGAILSVDHGMRWERGKFNKYEVRGPEGSFTNTIRQEILLEPNYNDWLFALDRPFWIEHQKSYLQNQLRTMDGFVFALNENYNKQSVYEVYSHIGSGDTISDSTNAIYLQSEGNKDSRVHQLLEDIQRTAKTNEDKANLLMRFYQKQFLYTLSPGTLKTGSLEEFLFEKKQGFCEHFAASFASLMRLMNVPSRVVVGFQGGKKNQLSDYYIVTTRDAHAWTEIWSETKQKWVRFDPTAMVAPLRIELGGENYHSMTEDELLANQNSTELAFDSSWWGQTQLALDALSTNWSLFLLNYDRGGQKSFFAKLGLENVNQNLMLMMSLLILLCYFLWVRMRNNKPEVVASPAQRAYLLLRRKLAKKGIEKEFSEGPRNFLVRCEQALPDSAVNIAEFRDAYLAQEYGQKNSDFDFRSCLRKIQ